MTFTHGGFGRRGKVWFTPEPIERKGQPLTVRDLDAVYVLLRERLARQEEQIVKLARRVDRLDPVHTVDLEDAA